MFKKKDKKPVEQKPNVLTINYTTWEADFGFLTLCINKKINREIAFNINLIPDMIVNGPGGADDNDVKESASNATLEILNSLSKNYIDFLLIKYFNSLQDLSDFVYSIIYENLIDVAVKANTSKIKKIDTENMMKAINDMTKK